MVLGHRRGVILTRGNKIFNIALVWRGGRARRLCFATQQIMWDFMWDIAYIFFLGLFFRLLFRDIGL